MELNCTIATLFLYQSIVLGNKITSFALNFVYYSRDNNIDCANRTPCVESLFTHDIIDKAAYLSQTTTQHLLFITLSVPSLYNQSHANE